MSNPPLPTSNATTVDLLAILFDAEQNSIFRFIGEGWPYLGKSSAKLRRPLMEMVKRSNQYARTIADLIDDLGGTIVSRGLEAGEQYLAYLTVNFLLPKLIESKVQTIALYESVIAQLVDPTAQVGQVLAEHLAGHQRDLNILQSS